jgi:acetoin utilization protein AcuB
MSISGFGKRGAQIACQIEDRPGSIKEVTDIVREHGGRLASILTSYERVPKGYRNLYVRMYDINRPTFENLLSALKGKCKLLYMVDHREGKREIYTQ